MGGRMSGELHASTRGSLLFVQESLESLFFFVLCRRRNSSCGGSPPQSVQQAAGLLLSCGFGVKTSVWIRRRELSVLSTVVPHGLRCFSTSTTVVFAGICID